MTITTNELTRAYGAIKEATDKALSAGYALELKKSELKKLILQAKHQGLIDGKNDGERDAQAMAMYPKEHEDIEKTEQIYRDYVRQLKLAEYDLQLLRDCLRVDELEAHKSALVIPPAPVQD